jgi:hypothetical protein
MQTNYTAIYGNTNAYLTDGWGTNVFETVIYGLSPMPTVVGHGAATNVTYTTNTFKLNQPPLLVATTMQPQTAYTNSIIYGTDEVITNVIIVYTPRVSGMFTLKETICATHFYGNGAEQIGYASVNPYIGWTDFSGASLFEPLYEDTTGGGSAKSIATAGSYVYDDKSFHAVSGVPIVVYDVIPLSGSYGGNGGSVIYSHCVALYLDAYDP